MLSLSGTGARGQFVQNDDGSVKGIGGAFTAGGIAKTQQIPYQMFCEWFNGLSPEMRARVVASLPENQDAKHRKLTPAQTATRDAASAEAKKQLADRPACREYVTGRKMNAKRAIRLFSNAVKSMTFDPSLILPAETDKDFRRIRLGSSFFDLSLLQISVLEEVEQLGGVKDSFALATAVSQQAYIQLHEFKHVATRKTHNTRVQSVVEGVV